MTYTAEDKLPNRGAWTPGPWRYVDDGYVEAANAPLRIRSGWYDYAYTKAANREEWEANARLISAAPCLYAALEAVERLLDLPAPIGGQVGAALAKARGEQ